MQNDGFGETKKEAPTPKPSVRNVPRKVKMDMTEQPVVQKMVAIDLGISYESPHYHEIFVAR